jgi:hypothetical protein
MDSVHESSGASWGTRINFGRHWRARSYPAVRSSDEREEQGLLIWEGEARQLRLSATQAIALLEHLRADDAWQQDGTVKEIPVLLSLLKKKGRAW